MSMQSVKAQLIHEVNKIPIGQVTNYGHIAELVTQARGSLITAQVVGWQLSGLTQEEWELCPWQRVVAKNGHISALKLGEKGWIQKEILATEGVQVREDDTVDMAKYGWYGG
jgi:alkylated DNA nucleotide flippase Atl1